MKTRKKKKSPSSQVGRTALDPPPRWLVTSRVQGGDGVRWVHLSYARAELLECCGSDSRVAARPGPA